MGFDEIGGGSDWMQADAGKHKLMHTHAHKYTTTDRRTNRHKYKKRIDK